MLGRADTSTKPNTPYVAEHWDIINLQGEHQTWLEAEISLNLQLLNQKRLINFLNGAWSKCLLQKDMQYRANGSLCC